MKRRPSSASPGGAAGRKESPCVCPDYHRAIELIGKRWSGAILLVLSEGPQRFGELTRAVPGLSDRLLSQRLRELEDADLVERSVEEGSPVRVSYELTSRGAELRPVIEELREWAQRWQLAAGSRH